MQAANRLSGNERHLPAVCDLQTEYVYVLWSEIHLSYRYTYISVREATVRGFFRKSLYKRDCCLAQQPIFLTRICKINVLRLTRKPVAFVIWNSGPDENGLLPKNEASSFRHTFFSVLLLFKWLFPVPVALRLTCLHVNFVPFCGRKFGGCSPR